MLALIDIQPVQRRQPPKLKSAGQRVEANRADERVAIETKGGEDTEDIRRGGDGGSERADALVANLIGSHIQDLHEAEARGRSNKKVWVS